MGDQDRIVGSKTLLRQLYALKVDTEVVFGAAGDMEVLIETLQQSQPAFYKWSILSTDPAIIDVWQTAGIILGTTAIGGGVQTALLKRRSLATPLEDNIDVILYISAALACTLKVKVYREVGLD